MIPRADERSLGARYHAAHPVAGLSDHQLRLLRRRASALQRWSATHAVFHCALNAALVAALFAADFALLLWCPSRLLDAGRTSVLRASGWGAGIGLASAWLRYGLTLLLLHEGSGHGQLFPPRGRFTRLLHLVASNAARLFDADPGYFREAHPPHHQHLGHDGDRQYASFVSPRTLWFSLLPFAQFFSECVFHRGTSWDRGRRRTAAVAFVYWVGGAWLIGARFGAAFALAVFFFSLNGVFWFDKLRTFVDHNLMGAGSESGTRDIGPGPWGFLIGGGPWGSCFHWTHHLFPALPWYQQAALHRFAKRVLTPEQRAVFMLDPLLGYPKVFVSLHARARAFENAAEAARRA